MIVQIYEIQTPQEAEKCIELGVDHIGSVLLCQNEWRIPSIKEAIRLSDGTESKNSLIPLFQDMDTLCRALDYYRPDYIHFCESLTYNDGGKKDMDRNIQIQSNLKKKFPEIGIIRSLPIPQKDVKGGFPTLNIGKDLVEFTDIFLTDTWLGNEPVHGYIGITGRPSDYKIAGELVQQSDIPVILAGGLSPDNVYDAVKNVLPAGADSCTKTNMLDGEGRPIRFKKDFSKVKKFVKEVRRAEK